ncbi:hypothetical protein ACFVKB_42750 [Rhodococcus sp. NPDC127530]|uniref:hypothetical protein n=1 Tax=unclassified Rhodococcus (in: high G+C Gram-positive bacteria) TaxID=192944 RepID=UPI003637E9A5
MNSGIPDELFNLGMAMRADDVEEVHRVAGPAATMICYRLPDGFVRYERFRDEFAVLPSIADAAFMSDLRTVLPWVSMPTITRSGIFYPGLLGRLRLVDVLMSSGPLLSEELRSLSAWHRTLGVQLAHLHSLECAGIRQQPTKIGKLDEVRAIIDAQPTSRQSSTPTEHLRAILHRRYPTLVARLVLACDHFLRCAGPSIVHGEYCPAHICLPDARYHDRNHRAVDPGLRTIGWLTAGYGCPAVDVGWFLGELCEASAMRAAASKLEKQHVAEFGQQFLRGYFPAAGSAIRHPCRDLVPTYAAAKILSHVASYVKYFPFHRGVLDVLDLADEVIRGAHDVPQVQADEKGIQR